MLPTARLPVRCCPHNAHSTLCDSQLIQQTELGWLIRALNPDVPLGDEALALIAGEVLHDYGNPDGTMLTPEGLARLYADGLADPERDFQLLMAHRGAEEAAAAIASAATLGSVAKRQKLDSAAPSPDGSVVSAASTGLAMSNVATATATATPTTAAKGGITPQDVFQDLFTPAHTGAVAAAAQAVGEARDTIKVAKPTPPASARSSGGDAFDFLATPRDPLALSAAAAAGAGLAAVTTGTQQSPAGGGSQPATPSADAFDGLFTPAPNAAPFTRPTGVPPLAMGGLASTRSGVLPSSHRMPDVFDALQTPWHGNTTCVDEDPLQEAIGESLAPSAGTPTAAAAAAAQATAAHRTGGFVVDATALMEDSTMGEQEEGSGTGAAQEAAKRIWLVFKDCVMPPAAAL